MQQFSNFQRQSELLCLWRRRAQGLPWILQTMQQPLKAMRSHAPSTIVSHIVKSENHIHDPLPVSLSQTGSGSWLLFWLSLQLGGPGDHINVIPLSLPLKGTEPRALTLRHCIAPVWEPLHCRIETNSYYLIQLFDSNKLVDYNIGNFFRICPMWWRDLLLWIRVVQSCFDVTLRKLADPSQGSSTRSLFSYWSGTYLSTILVFACFHG